MRRFGAAFLLADLQFIAGRNLSKYLI